MTYNLEDAEIAAQFGPQRVYQRNNLLILECKSNLSQGGFSIRKDAYDWLTTNKDVYDCGVSLTNTATGWSKLVSLADLPVNEAREGHNGAYWIVDPSDFGDYEPAPHRRGEGGGSILTDKLRGRHCAAPYCSI